MYNSRAALHTRRITTSIMRPRSVCPIPLAFLLLLLCIRVYSAQPRETVHVVCTREEERDTAALLLGRTREEFRGLFLFLGGGGSYHSLV